MAEPDTQVIDQGSNPPVEPDATTATVVEPTVPAVDDRGVPYQQSAAEFQRKYNESQAELNKVNAQNQQYQVALGKQQQQAQQTQAPPDTTTGYSTEDLAMVDARARTIAQEVAKTIMTQAEVNSAVSEDPELRKLAEVEYGKVLNNPSFAPLDEATKQSLAVQQARSLQLQQQLTAAKENTTVAEPVTVNSAASSLPETGPSGIPDRTDESPDADLDFYWAQDESVQTMQRMLRSIGHNTPFNKNDETIVNFFGKRISVKDLCAQIAERAVRKGVQLTGAPSSMQGAK